MAVTVAASSLKEALELLAADIAECCDCGGGCCPGKSCWQATCPDGVVATALSGTITFDWSILTICTDCQTLLPTSVSVDVSDIYYVAGTTGCDTAGSFGEVEGSSWTPTTCIDGFNYTDFNLYTDGCEAQSLGIFRLCEDGVPKLQFFIGISQGCGIENKEDLGVLDGVATDACCSNCDENLEIKVPLTATCEGSNIRLQGSSGGITFDLHFTLGCA